MSSTPTNSGIVTDAISGERLIPESQRADGTTRKAIKIRPGYRPPEDIEVYKNRVVETFCNRGKGGVPGAEGLTTTSSESSKSSAANKNAKRKEARKRAKANNEQMTARAQEERDDSQAAKAVEPATAAAQSDAGVNGGVDLEKEKEKKARNVRKRLKQARELKSKKDGGGVLLPEQMTKVIRINELVRELEALGLDPDEPGDKLANGAEADEKKPQLA